MPKPKVSICIPAYKQPELLERALNSIFIQDYKDFEVIITDDSPDNSVEEIVKKFLDHKNLKYVKNTIKQGSPGNWNASIALAKGEYIKILHHDDWFLKETSLSHFVKLLDENPDVNFAFGGSKNFDDKGNVTYDHRANPDQIFKLKEDPIYTCLINFIGAPSATIYRNNINHVFDVNLKWFVDIEFYAQVLLDNSKFAYSTELLMGILDFSPNRVTTESVGKADVEIFEFLYLYKKITSRTGYKHSLFKHLWHLFERYGVNSKEQIVNYGFAEPFPSEVYILLKYQSIFKRFQKVIFTVKKVFSLERWLRILFIFLSYINIKLEKRK